MSYKAVMGMYTDGNVYGVYIYTYDDDDNLTVLLDKKYDAKMTTEQIIEVKTEFDNLSEDISKEISIRFYVSCNTSYELANSGPFISLWPGSLAMLEELFEKGDIRI